MMKRRMVALLSCCLAVPVLAQGADANPNLPQPGTMAPPIALTTLLQAPAGTKATLASLRGKVVVLEFWATWCAPCLGEIPVINGLAASLDPSKVQFISVDDEDPAKVQAFLKKTTMKGWVGLDGTGKMFESYKVSARPVTIVIGPDGRVVSSNVPPQNLKREKLLALASGRKTEVSGAVDPKVQAEHDAAMQKAFAEQMGPAVGGGGASLFDLRVSASAPAKAGETPDTHLIMGKEGVLTMTNASIETLLTMTTGTPKSRVKVVGTLPETAYDMNVNAPHIEKAKLNGMIEAAIASATGVGIEHQSASMDAYVMTVLPGGAKNVAAEPGRGFAVYAKKHEVLQCVSASVDQVASALEEAVGKPVVNETGLKGSVTALIPLAKVDAASVNAALAEALGVTLTPARREIATVVLTAPVKVAEKAEAGK